MSVTPYTGSCHCGAVRFAAEVDVAAGTTKCNCTWCWKHRWWSVKTEPGRFELRAGADRLSGGAKGGFCKGCGVFAFQVVNTDGWGEGFGGELISLNVTCLDDLDVDTLLAAPVQYCDGLHDNWWSPPAEIRHL